MKLDLLKRELKQSSKDYIYETLRANILSLKLPPGMAISESELTSALQVSRTPLREAFVKLSDEELIEIHPQKGTFVSRIDLQQIVEARFVRENMEVAVAKMACDRFEADDLQDLEFILSSQKIYRDRSNFEKLSELDEQFHQMLFEKCDMLRTWKIIQQMQGHYKRLRQLLLSVNAGWDQIVLEHGQILRCIKMKNKELVEQEVRNHMRLFIYVQAEKLKEMYPDFIKQ